MNLSRTQSRRLAATPIDNRDPFGDLDRDAHAAVEQALGTLTRELPELDPSSTFADLVQALAARVDAQNDPPAAGSGDAPAEDRAVALSSARTFHFPKLWGALDATVTLSTREWAMLERRNAEAKRKGRRPIDAAAYARLKGSSALKNTNAGEGREVVQKLARLGVRVIRRST